MKAVLLTLIVFVLSGCCLVAPCHMGTEVVGYVNDVYGKPIKDATVTLYGSPVKTDTNGCFYFNMADALPFELSVEATGFNQVKTKAPWGKFVVKVTLTKDEQQELSTIIWKKSDGAINNCT